MPQLEQLAAQLDRLAAFDPGPFPVVSLYLNLQPDSRGRDQFAPFLRKEMAERLRTYPAEGPERESLERDASTIEDYVGDLPPSANALALFACSGGGLFEAIELAAPIDDHRLHISRHPHLYPLAHMLDEYRRCLVLLADTQSARIFVFAANAVERTDRIEGVKTKRHKMGGMSQARYQRHVENYHLHHAKEIVDVIARTVRDEKIEQIVIAGDEVIVPLLRDQMPKDVSERVIDVVRLDINTPEREVFDTIVATLREKDADTDRERVDALINAYRGNGLACAGLEQTKRALTMGQVDELVIAATPSAFATGDKPSDEKSSTSKADDVADELVAQARNTAAKIRFIEDAQLLAPLGGVGAFLRFKV